MSKFDEQVGKDIADDWFLAQMTENPPPTAEQLYEKLRDEAVLADS